MELIIAKDGNDKKMLVEEAGKKGGEARAKERKDTD